MAKFSKQRGFLLISTTVLIVVIVGILGGLIAYFALTSSYSMLNQKRMNQAHYIAESGLRAAIYHLMAVIQSENITCENITSSAALTDISFGGGQYTVTAIKYFPDSPSILTAGIDANVTTIPISSLTGYAPSGRIIIDNEAINYGGTSTAVDTCGIAPCLTGAQRGVAPTTATSHSLGTWINQNQCYLTSRGAVPNFSSPLAERQISEGVLLGFGGGFIVGGSTSTETILGWNGLKWYQMGPYTGVPDKGLNGVFISTLFDAWAVGSKIPGSSANINYWNGTNWAQISAPLLPTPFNIDLKAVTCLLADDCWAVGENRTFLHYSDTGWQPIESSNLIDLPSNKNINALSCIASKNCYAVGDSDGTPLVANWNGSTWTRVPLTGFSNKNLNAINCTSDGNCWAAGANALFLRYNTGTGWSEVAPAANVPGTATINGLDCVTPTDCWAVGDQTGGSSLFVRYQGAGTLWTRFTLGVTFNQKLYSVACADPNDCWASGAGHQLARWNGQTWVNVNPDTGVPSIPLTSISMIFAGHGRLSIWEE